MKKPQPQPIELEFSRKYDKQHAQHYFEKHHDGIFRKLSNWREQSIARKALEQAGNPEVVLDLPCGAGRFWPMLASHQPRTIIAADNSQHMIEVALQSHPAHLTAQVKTLKTSAFSIELDDGSVDCVFCMRLLHHISDKEHRLSMLKEFHRVTRDTVVVSLWVDGNYMAWKRKRLESRRAKRGTGKENQNRFVIPAESIENEFRTAGFKILGYQDFLPGYSMWRIYTLRK